MTMWLILRRITFCLLLILPETTQAINKCPSASPLNNTEGRLTALRTAFPQERLELDLIISVDRSMSISAQTEPYNEIIDYVGRMVRVLSDAGRVSIHPDFTRLALLTTGKGVTVDLDGMTTSTRAVSSCNVNNHIQNLYNPIVENGTDALDSTLLKAERLFTTRPGATKKILWVFYDGEYELGASQRTVSAMKGRGVTVFTVGVGQWFAEVVREDRMISLATDANHYACLEGWEAVLDEMKNTQRQGEGSPSDPLYAESPESCTTSCSEDTVCVCDVIHRTYSCKDCSDIEGCYRYQKKPVTQETWFYIVIAAVIVFIGGIVLAVVVAVRLRRKKKTPSSDPSEPSEPPPPPPLPPLVPRRNTRPQATTHTQGYQDVDNDVYYNDNSVPELKTTEELNAEEIITASPDFVPSNYAEKGLTDWGQVVYETSRDQKLLHVRISTKDGGRGAWTMGYKITTQELKNLAKVISQSPTSRPPNIKLAGNSYELDKKFDSDFVIHASSKKKDEVYAARKGDYVVLAMANPEFARNCEDVVYHFYHSLKSTEDYDDVEIQDDGFQSNQEMYENV